MGSKQSSLVKANARTAGCTKKKFIKGKGDLFAAPARGVSRGAVEDRDLSTVTAATVYGSMIQKQENSSKVGNKQ